MSENERILLLIGASSDIGSSLIKKIAGNYTTIWAHYNHSRDEIYELREVFGEKIIPVRADLTNTQEIGAMIHEIKESHRMPDHIVHLAAPKTVNLQFPKCKWIDFQENIDISLRSIILILEEFIPVMTKQRYGKIVFVLSSYVVGIPPKYQSPYVVTKYAILGLMKCLASEYSDRGITVNAVSPEMINTKFINELPDLVKEGNAIKMPIGRNLEVDDVVPALQYLLSNGANTVTGQNIAITGGK